MKKIVLCGATHGSNFGDTIFAYMFYSYLSNSYPEIDFRFTEVSEYTKKYLDVLEIDKNFLENADGLIFISGGFFGESHGEKPRGAIKRYRKYFHYGYKFMRSHKKIAISGVGAGPLSRNWLRNCAVKIFNYADVITVRDQESMDFMVKYGVTEKMTVTSDSAQCIKFPEFEVDLSTTKQLPISTSQKNVLIHVSESIDFNFYTEKVLIPLAEILPQDIHLIITNDVVGNIDSLNKVREVFAKFDCSTYAYSDPFEFMTLIANADSIITPKLHVGIFGATFGKPVLSFPLHPEKTLRYYKQIGFSDHSYSLFDLEEKILTEMVTDLLWKPIAIDKSLIDSAKYNFDVLNEFILGESEER